MLTLSQTKRVLVMGGLLSTVLLAGCGDQIVDPGQDGDDEQKTTTQAEIVGTVTLDPGIDIDLKNARVAIYAGILDFVAEVATETTSLRGDSPQFSFQTGPLNPGNYFLDIWKDFNLDGTIDTDDFYVVFGADIDEPTAIKVLEQESKQIDLRIKVGDSSTLVLVLM
ncbi:MAG: hypothetical protein ACE5IY_04715 [bacterium]